MLRFAELEGGDLKLTEAGTAFAPRPWTSASASLRASSPVRSPALVRRVLDERASHVARKSRFIDELEDS
jgi:NitT/TauT family transport system ATP-binding protein